MTALLNMPGILGLLTPPLAAEYAALIPGLLVGVLALLVILLDVFHRSETSRGYLGYISAVGLGLALASCWFLWDATLPEATFHGMVYLDKFALFFAGLSCLTGIGACLLAPEYLRAHNMDRGEYYMLVILSVLGMIFMANAADLLTFFLALEVMSIPVYVLAAFLRKESRSAEAGMKYFILGAFSTGLLLYGIALIYGVAGTTNLAQIAENLSTVLADPASASAAGALLTFGVMLVLSGFLFKIAAVPFHIWTPDVYTGSPTPAVAFMSTGVKAAAFAAMIRVFVLAFYANELRGGFFGVGWIDVMAFVAGASMILGNFAAIVQTNVKRMLAYSSIAHAGYIMVGVVAANASPAHFLYNDSVLFYLITYTVGTIGAFGVLSYIGRTGETAETYDDLSGLGFKYPMVGLVMGVCMFSSAGIPPTAGFLGKLYVFRGAVDVGQSTGEFMFIGLAILGVLTSVAGVYYYLKVLVHMYMRPTNDDPLPILEFTGAKFTIVVSAFAVLYIGILPGSTVDLAREAIVDFRGAPASIQPAIAQGKADLEEELADAPAEAQVEDAPAVEAPPTPAPTPVPAPAAAPTPAPAADDGGEADQFGRKPGEEHYGHGHP